VLVVDDDDDDDDTAVLERPSEVFRGEAGDAPGKDRRPRTEFTQEFPENASRQKTRVQQAPFAENPMRVSRRSTLYFQAADPVVAVRITGAMQDLLRAMAASASARDSSSHIEEVFPGSVRIRFKKFMRTLLESPDAQLIADQVRQGLEANFIEKTQSDIALNISNSMAALMTAAKDADTVAVDAGQFVIAKITDRDGKAHWRAKAYDSRELAQRHVTDRQLENPHELFESLAPKTDPPSVDQ